MSLNPDRANPPANQVPVILCDELNASEAYEVHIALLKAEKANPSLRDNPIWTIHRQDAYERFAVAFKKVCS